MIAVILLCFVHAYRNDRRTEKGCGIGSADIEAVEYPLQPEHPITGNMLQGRQMSLFLFVLSVISM